MGYTESSSSTRGLVNAYITTSPHVVHNMISLATVAVGFSYYKVPTYLVTRIRFSSEQQSFSYLNAL